MVQATLYVSYQEIITVEVWKNLKFREDQQWKNYFIYFCNGKSKVNLNVNVV